MALPFIPTQAPSESGKSTFSCLDNNFTLVYNGYNYLSPYKGYPRSLYL